MDIILLLEDALEKRTTHRLYRERYGIGRYVFFYDNGRRGWAYTNAIAGLPPFMPLCPGDLDAEDWILTEVSNAPRRGDVK